MFEVLGSAWLISVANQSCKYLTYIHLNGHQLPWLSIKSHCMNRLLSWDRDMAYTACVLNLLHSGYKLGIENYWRHSEWNVTSEWIDTTLWTSWLHKLQGLLQSHFLWTHFFIGMYVLISQTDQAWEAFFMLNLAYCNNWPFVFKPTLNKKVFMKTYIFVVSQLLF